MCKGSIMFDGSRAEWLRLLNSEKPEFARDCTAYLIRDRRNPESECAAFVTINQEGVAFAYQVDTLYQFSKMVENNLHVGKSCRLESIVDFDRDCSTEFMARQYGLGHEMKWNYPSH